MHRVIKVDDMLDSVVEDNEQKEDGPDSGSSSLIFIDDGKPMFTESSKRRVVDGGIEGFVSRISTTEIITEFMNEFADSGGESIANAMRSTHSDTEDWIAFNKAFGELLRRGHVPTDIFVVLQQNIADDTTLIESEQDNSIELVMNALDEENMSILRDYMAHKYHIRVPKPSRSIERFVI